MLLHEFYRAPVQHARSPIIAETAPGGQHGLFASPGERLDIRKTFEENPVVVEHRGYARLLQHDLAEPDAVGIASFTPGKVAAMLAVPAEEVATETGHVLAGGADQGPRTRVRFDGYPRTHDAIVPCAGLCGDGALPRPSGAGLRPRKAN